MTVDECAVRMLEHFMPGMQSCGSPALEAAKAAAAVNADLRALILTESERNAAICDEACEWATEHGSAADGPLADCRDEILRTSPGKGGA